MHRRQFLHASTLASVSLLGWPGSSLARQGDPRFVLVILRGGLDGLAAIAPYGDPAYRQARGPLAMGSDELLTLDGFFGAHPSLVNFHTAYAAGDALAVHAVASPYRDRSHFEAQNVLEHGLEEPYATDQGWLNRVLASGSGRSAIAISPTVPLVLRGTRVVSSWAPSALPDPNDGIMERLLDLYDAEELLGPSLRTGLAVDEMAGSGVVTGLGRGNPNAPLPVEVLARFLTAPEGPRVAVVEVGGWDTHANQANQLSNRLSFLDEGFGRLETLLAEAWNDTVILTVSEFGRTVAANGTSGTDHGTAGVVLMLGGAVNGGRVVADWPGLVRSELYQGRDLYPTVDVRGLFSAIVRQHLGFDLPSAGAVFPGVRHGGPFDELIA